jgi:DNA-binding MarR family transcriptional regulator
MASKTSTRATGAKLSDFLCFAVYSANLAFGKAYRPLLDELGLTYTQYITLVCLSEQDGQTVSELGGKLFLESNTLTPILKKLEAMGYVQRERSTADERQVHVSLTPAGRRLREQAVDRGPRAATGLSAEEFRTLQKAISRLRDNLVEATAEAG